MENKSLNFVLLRRQIDARVGRVTCYGTHVLLWDAGLESRVGTAPKPKVISIDLAPKRNPQSLPQRSSPKKKGRIGIHALPARVRDGSLQSARNERLSLLPQAQEDREVERKNGEKCQGDPATASDDARSQRRGSTSRPRRITRRNEM